MNQGFDPTVERVEKVLVEPRSGPSPQGQTQDIKAKIAETVRANARERAALTPLDAIVELAPDLPRSNISNILTGMTAEEGYGDIRAVTTASELVFFYSETYIKVAEAAAKSLQEEVKFRIGEKVRADSRDNVTLTPVQDLYAQLGVDSNAFNPCEICQDARYADIKTVNAFTSGLYFYSDIYMSGNYALILARAAADSPCATIAETVRDASRIYPRPTNCQLFREKAFGIIPDNLEAIIAETLQKPEFSDIKKMVHPSTKAVYLYSSRYLPQDRAWEIMDWEEVGRQNNP